MSAMSLLQRVSSSLSSTRLPRQRTPVAEHGRDVAGPGSAGSNMRRSRTRDGLEPTRFAFPNGVFAALETEPAETAEIAYAAFAHHALTPTLAEREVLRALRGHQFHCRPVESSTACRWEQEQFRDRNGEIPEGDRLRIVVRHLVRMQLIHETNVRELARLRATRAARRVRLLPGCCPVCDELAQASYRVSSAPPLPVHGCQRHGGCVCGWVGV